MARIRSIKPEFFTSEDVSALPLRARLTWIGLWLHCDDHGRTKDLVKLIKANIWVLDDVSLRDVEDDLALLAAQGRIVRYQVAGVRYLAVQNWHRHQSINRPGRPKFPAPPVPIAAPEPGESGHCPTCWVELQTHTSLSEPSRPVDNSNVDVPAGKPTHEQSTEDSVNGHGGLTPGKEGNRERKGGEDARARDQPPPPRCPKHINNPTDTPCRACGDARRAAEAWDVVTEAERRRDIRECRHCDADGWRREHGRASPITPYIRCDHTRDQLERLAQETP